MEAEAIRLGVRFMRKQGIHIFRICSDSLSLIQLLQSGSPGPPQVQDAITEIQRTDGPHSAWQCCKVPRDLVHAPEVLARFVQRKNKRRITVEDFAGHSQPNWMGMSENHGRISFLDPHVQS
ncbi:hypothetical protein QJS10_CPA08g00511 [Acorus calamus]|uniref:RNase H type-1 domain-containing protein n=1 Tax=Acorus calamus TaxID=4465 RepID=A0AAV9ECD7_ACOCL|nr:hypothetical protein QJS10_CPA08g00511 [Acorus calamus]